MITVEEAKKYLRIEPEYTEEDEDISGLIAAAYKYLRNAGCILQDGDELAELAQKMLVVHWYENREAVGDANASELPFGLRNLIEQLKYCYEDETSV
jgi:uncharacterized phage protein (predicted DNA packaging)